MALSGERLHAHTTATKRHARGVATLGLVAGENAGNMVTGPAGE